MAYAPMKVVKGIGLGFKALKGLATMGKANKAIKATCLTGKAGISVAQKATKVFQKRFGVGYDKFKHLRKPWSIHDQLALKLAKADKGTVLPIRLADPRYLGWEKMQCVLESKNGIKSVIHYVRHPRTGQVEDFKFVKRAMNTL